MFGFSLLAKGCKGFSYSGGERHVLKADGTTNPTSFCEHHTHHGNSVCLCHSFLSSPQMAPWLHCLIMSRQKLGRLGHLAEGERGGHRNQTRRMHMQSQSPCQCLEADTQCSGWHQALSHWNQALIPQSKSFCLGQDAFAIQRRMQRRRNLKMWFSIEGPQYSKMLLFLLSLPFIYSEPGLLTWVTRSYFCFFLQLFLKSKCVIKGQSTCVLKNKQHNLGF